MFTRYLPGGRDLLGHGYAGCLTLELGETFSTDLRLVTLVQVITKPIKDVTKIHVTLLIVVQAGKTPTSDSS
jgi:hypothetical protein